MAQRGKHTLQTGEAGEDNPNEGSWGCLLVMMAIAAALIVALNLLPEQREPSPSEPQAPQSRTATFYGEGQDGQPLVLHISGGSYEVVYLQAGTAEAEAALAKAGEVFAADFSTRKTSGDPAAAETWVLVGSPNLSVATLGKNDAASADFIARAGSIERAFFRYNAPSTGPPDEKPPDQQEVLRKTIIVVGALASVTIDGLAGNSFLKTSTLELDPAPEEWAKYRREMDAHQRAVEELRVQEEQVRREEHSRPRAARGK